MNIIEILSLLALFAGSAFFSGAEAALTTLSILKMKRLAVQHPGLVRHLNDWMSRPHRLLVTMLVGNNAVNIAISSLAATILLPRVASLPPFLDKTLVWFSTTFALLVAGEIVPKIVGRTYAEKVSVFAFPVLGTFTRSLSMFFRPAHWLLDRFARGIESAPVNRLTALSFEEAHHIISESQAAGQMSQESGAMMDRVLALDRRAVRDIMQPPDVLDMVPVEPLAGDAKAQELFVDLLVETGRTRVPVTRNGAPVGFVHVMDLLKEWRSGRVDRLQELVRPATWVKGSMPVSDLLAEFRRTGDQIVLVRGDDGSFAGLAALEDLLEEIVGEIVDEYDVEKKKE